MKLIVTLLLTVIVAGCSRPSVAGLYQSVGSEDKFRMSLEVADGGRAKFTTRANLGSAELNRAVESSMSVADGQWKKEAATLLVAGMQGDGKSVTYRFAIQENGDLV